MSEGKVFKSSSEIDPEDENLLKYPSLGHRILERLKGPNRETTIFVDAASGRQWKGGDLADKILNVACGLLQEYGMMTGDVACISYDHSDYICILALAIIVTGGAVVCAYPKDPYAELLYLARKVGPRFLFCHKRNLHWAKQLEIDTGSKVIAYALDDESSFNKISFLENLLDYDYCSQCLNHPGKTLPTPFETIDKQLAFITMSSGTTGKPKAIAVTHRACLADMKTRFAGQKGINVAVPSSLDYVSGRVILLGAIENGFKAVIVNITEPAFFLETIERHKINILFMGTASFYNLITHPDVSKRDLSSLRVIFPAGAKVVYLNELEAFLAKHPKIVMVRQAYGTSETGCVAFKSSTPQEYLRDCDCCGKLLPGHQAKVVCPETGKLLGKNQVGLLRVKCPNPFPGYFDLERMRDGQSKRADDNGNEPLVSPYFRDSTVYDEDGFYLTGDLASFNDNEELYMHGRLKELMNCRAAKKVLPSELEEIIEAHPAISRVCVIGMPNLIELTLHCPRAFVVPKSIYYTDVNKLPQADSSCPSDILVHRGEHKLCTMQPEHRRKIAESLMAFVDSRVGWEKQLTGGIVILDHIPTLRNTGKFDKGYLRGLGYNQVEIYGDRSGQK